MRLFRKGLKTFIAILFLMACACATPPEPFEYKTERELKPGPGLFSGEEGAFVIYRVPARTDDEEAEKE